MSTAIISVVEGQIVVGNELSLLVKQLLEDSSKLVVHDQDTYIQAQTIVKRGDDAVKFIEAAAEPERIVLHGRYKEFLARRDEVIASVRTAYSSLAEKARQWNIAERQRAADEQAKLNKGKKPENQVVVAPAIPQAAKGVIVHWRFEVVNAKKIKPQFMCPDEKAILKRIREIGDVKKAEAEIGGIKVRME
jgi:hypothetical protein